MNKYEITLGGVTYELKYDFNSMIELEKKGIRIQEMGDEDKLMSNMRGMLWAGLLHSHPEITLEEVGAMISMKEISYFMETMTNVFMGLSK